MANYHFLCTQCGTLYRPHQVTYVCPRHGDDGVLDTIIEYESNARPPVLRTQPHSIWRYADLLPVESAAVAHLLEPHSPLASVGWTPLYHAAGLGGGMNVGNLYVKDDGRNPSASFKDRASALVVAKARERGEHTVTTASSGNAGAALACLCAAAGLHAVVFVPQSAPAAKVAQLLMFGATVLLVGGTYDVAFDLCLAAARAFGWYCRNTAYNPFTIEGKKTVSFEICEQLNWKAPDCIFVAVGDGNIIGGVWKGLKDLMAAGWIERMPRLYGVQAEGSAACYNAWRAARSSSRAISISPVVPQTLADSISVGLPRDGVRAVRAVLETGGEFLAVTDDEILSAMKALSRQAAVFAEPAGAAGFAGVQKAVRQGIISAHETVVAIVTGSGLKDIPSAMRTAGSANVIEPTLEAVAAALAPRGH